MEHALSILVKPTEAPKPSESKEVISKENPQEPEKPKEEKKKPSPLHPITIAMKVFYYLKEILISEIKSKYIPTFQTAVFDALENLTEDDLRPIRKEEIEELIRHCKSFGECVEEGKKKLFEKCEMRTLDFGLKCLNTNLLEKRLWGITFIETVLQSVAYSYLGQSIEDYSFSRNIDAR